MRTRAIMRRMHRLAVWDNEGQEYLPEFDNQGQVVRYARAEQAISNLIHNYNEWVYRQVSRGV